MAQFIFASSGSAEKHGVPRPDVEHAIRNHLFWIRAFDEPRGPGLARPDLFVGPDRAARIYLEVMATWLADGSLFVFHAMPLRESIKVRMRKTFEAGTER